MTPSSDAAGRRRRNSPTSTSSPTPSEAERSSADFSFDESSSISGFGDATIGGGVFSATFEIFDDFTGEPIGTGSAEGTATLTGGRSRTVEDNGLGTVKIVSRTLAVEGTLTVEIDGVVDEIALDAEHCNGEAREIRRSSLRPRVRVPGS